MRRNEIRARYGYLVLDWLEKKYGKSELYWMTEIAVAVRGVRALQERFPGVYGR